MNWKAKWIWDSEEEHPRNWWLAFRKKFISPDDFDEALLNITADSRYVVYVNGRRVGSGPVRSWPFEQSYDSWSVKDYLATDNVIAVLVTHYGISTFQYIEGRGGLIAQLDFYKNGEIIDSLCTDKSWKNKLHSGYIRSSVRISCQQAWAEIYDARKFDERWVEVDFDDSSWNNSIEIGSYGMKPWEKLVPRDIPHLAEEPIYPKRVISLKEVSPVKTHISIDIRPNFYPQEYDANPKRHLGYIATIINAPKAMRGKIVFPFGRWVSAYGRFRINDQLYQVDRTNSVEVNLNAGENFFLMDVSGSYHELFVHLAFDFEERLSFKAPLLGSKYKFVTIGPFDKKTVLLPGYSRDDALKEVPEYRKVWRVSSAEELTSYSEWIKPVLPEHTCTENVFTLSTVKNTLKTFKVPDSYQNLVMANDAYTKISASKNDQEIIVDFGRELSGYLEFDLDAPPGAILDFYFFESMHDGTIEDTNGLNNTLRYITKQGRQSYRSFVRRGFRYIMLTIRNLKSLVKFYSLKAYLSTFPVAEMGTFQCSDYLLNRIWEISRDTERLCMEDTYVDCPAYEQTFWVGDARNESLINYYTFGAYQLSRRCLNLVIGSMRRSILPESQVPSGWQNILTAWTLLWIIACKEYYEFTADKEFLNQIYPALIQTAKNFEKFINKDGLLEITAWNMLDWAPMDTPNSGVVTHQNALLVKALGDVAYLANLLGRDEDKSYLLDFANTLKEAINKHLWSKEKRAYIDSIHSDGKPSETVSQQTNIIVYLCDCAIGERKKILESYLLNPPDHFVKIGSPFMSFFRFEALVKLNRIDKVLEEIRENWGTMLKYGATTCWETFIGFQKDRLTRSHCHAWSSAPGYFLGAYVLGIRPLEPGFKKILIQPRLCGLRWARGSVPSPFGKIEVSYEDKDDCFDVFIDIPQESKAELIFPEDIKKRIKVNGQYIPGTRKKI